MRLEITIDDSALKDLFLPVGNDKSRMNRVIRINRHTLVVSEELLAEWEKGMKQYKLIELYNDRITIPYRLAVFGKSDKRGDCGKTRSDRITVSRL